MGRRYRVFVSSASDMTLEREQVIRAVRACDCIPCVMEDWTAGIQSPLRKILQEIDLCDFFILLLGHRYGARPQWTEDDIEAARDAEKSSLMSDAEWKETSYVVIEYEHARQRGKPIVALLSDEKRAGDERKADIETEGESASDLQKAFRDRVRNTLCTKTWHNDGELQAYVTSSILDKIRPLEAALVVETNADLIAEVSNYINTRAALHKRAEKAILVQYSSRNVRDIIRKLLWSRVKTELYVVSDKFALKHQKKIVDGELSSLMNHLDPIDPKRTTAEVMALLQIYRYDAPGSLRAISIDDDFLAIGSYMYMKKTCQEEGEVVDIRGGELPMAIFRETHAGFLVLKGMLNGLLKNWHDNKTAVEWDKAKTDARL
jgi:hypothetical protein